MQPVAADVAWSVCVSACVCLLDTRESYKNSEPIEMLLGCGLWNRVLGGGPDAPGKGPFSWLSPPIEMHYTV